MHDTVSETAKGLSKSQITNDIEGSKVEPVYHVYNTIFRARNPFIQFRYQKVDVMVDYALLRK